MPTSRASFRWWPRCVIITNDSMALGIHPDKAKYGRDGWFRITIDDAEENRMAVQAVRDFYLK